VREHTQAARIAVEAGDLLLALRERAGREGLVPEDLRRAADREAHELIAAQLAHSFPADALLSEEGVDDPRRLTAERLWIVDPLDGTKEYAEPSSPGSGRACRSDWAVHVALWQRDPAPDGAAARGGRARRGRLVAGAVALPALGVVLSTPSPPRPGPPVGRPLRVVVSRSRPPAVARAAAAAIGAELVPLGSAGAKAMAVVRGEADAYVHAGGMYEWDSAAPVAVAAAAGLHVSRVDGSPMAYNRPGAWLPDLLICRPELAAPILAATS
jgi:3'(2'), 5'-bisphosphate nucleotidase